MKRYLVLIFTVLFLSVGIPSADMSIEHGDAIVLFDSSAGVISNSTIDPTLATDHSYSGTTVSQAVGESVVFGQSVYFDLSEVEWKLADASAIGTMPVEGIALETKGNGEVCKILLWGYIRDDSWNWTIDDTVKFVWDSTTAGGISETAPSVTTELAQKVGTIRSADIIYFKPDWTLVTIP